MEMRTLVLAEGHAGVRTALAQCLGLVAPRAAGGTAGTLEDAVQPAQEQTTDSDPAQPVRRRCAMEGVCVACGGRGVEDQVDPSLPPPPCRVCRPAAAERHQLLARVTLRVVTARRYAAYRMLQEAGRQAALVAV